MTPSDRLYQITSLTRDALNSLEKGRDIKYQLRRIEYIAHDGCDRVHAIEEYFVTVLMVLCFFFAIVSGVGCLAFLINGRFFLSILCGVAASFLLPAGMMLSSHLGDL